jgi:flagellar capping protein FliD
LTEKRDNNIEKINLYTQIEGLSSDITSLDNQKERAKKKVHRTYNTIELIPKGIA